MSRKDAPQRSHATPPFQGETDTTAGCWKLLNSVITLGIPGVALLVSALSLLGTKRNSVVLETITVNQHLNDAWDHMGGQHGTPYFFRTCERDPTKLTLARHSLNDALARRPESVILQLADQLAEDDGTSNPRLSLSFAWSMALESIGLQKLIAHNRTAFVEGVYFYCEEQRKQSLLNDKNELTLSGADIHLSLGFDHQETGNSREAIYEFATAAKASPSSPQPSFYSALILKELEQHSLAHQQLAKALEKQGQFDAARLQYGEALRLEPFDDTTIAAYYLNLFLEQVSEGSLRTR